MQRVMNHAATTVTLQVRKDRWKEKILLQFDKGHEKCLKTGQHDLKWYLCSDYFQCK